MLRVLVYLVVLAGLVYAMFWVIARRNAPTDGQGRGGGTGGGGTSPRPPRGPMGPDDDEDFLRELDRQRKREKKPEDPA